MAEGEAVCGAIANLLRSAELETPEFYQGVRRAYGAALDAAGLTTGLPPTVGELLGALADCVVKATEYGTQDGGFVAMYLLPTGPIHRAIPLLERYGVTVRPGFDGRTSSDSSGLPEEGR